MAGEIKQFKDVNNNNHKVDITGVEGLQTALDGKAASNHTHSGIVGAYATEYVKLENNRVAMQGEGVDIYASDQDGGTINLKVSKEEGGSITASVDENNIGKLNNVLAGTIPQSDVSGLSSALDGKAASTHTHTKSDITDFAHTHAIADVTGLQAALDDKLSSNVTVYNMPVEWTPKDLSTMVTGNLYLFVNNPRARLDAIINNDEDVTLNYHQNAGSTNNEFIMVRIYRWESLQHGVFALCEIVGAWNSPSN